MTNVLVTKVLFEGRRAVGVEVIVRGETRRIRGGGAVMKYFLSQ